MPSKEVLGLHPTDLISTLLKIRQLLKEGLDWDWTGAGLGLDWSWTGTGLELDWSTLVNCCRLM